MPTALIEFAKYLWVTAPDDKGGKHTAAGPLGKALVVLALAVAMYYGSKDGAREGAREVVKAEVAPEIQELREDIREIRGVLLGGASDGRGRARAALPSTPWSFLGELAEAGPAE